MLPISRTTAGNAELRVEHPLSQARKDATTVVKDINQLQNDRTKDLLAAATAASNKLKVAFDGLTVQFEQLFLEVRTLRSQTFEYVNKDTDRVYGKLREGYTAADRDIYIAKLGELHTLLTAIDKLSKANEHVDTKAVAFIHHGSFIFGDLKALSKGKPVPDFSYNSGSIQFK